MSRFLDFLFPPRCPCCGTVCQLELCEACKQQLTPTTQADCRPDWNWDGLLQEFRAVFRYQGASRRAVLRLKFGRSAAAADLPGRLMALAATQMKNYPQFSCVVPVPLHRTRLRTRGFNQSELLARHIAKQTGIPLRTRSLQRIRNTTAQSTLALTQRRCNLHDAFAAKGVSGLHVLLVDDVATTGSTARECAKTLLEAGAASVSLCCFATATMKINCQAKSGVIE